MQGLLAPRASLHYYDRMNSSDYWDVDVSSLWHPYTRKPAAEDTPFPLIARGKGPFLYDVDDVRYLDAISSWWCCNLGHSHPRLVAAIRRQVTELQHSILGGLSHPPAVQLAAELVSLFPDSPRRVLFGSDGSSAVEAALKIAIQFWHNIGVPERRVFVSLENAYHGDTVGAASVGYVEAFHHHFDSMLFDVRRAKAPCCIGCADLSADGSCDLPCFESMRSVIEEHSDEIAGVIVEPLCQGAGGMNIYGPRYLAALAELCIERDVLLIVDEIATGMGRTGSMFAFEQADINPDIICLGKGLTGGYLPLSATVVKEGMYNTFTGTPDSKTLCHGHTFSGNPIACAAALETLKIYEEDDIVGQADRLGLVLAEEIAGLAGLPGVTNTRSLGMIGAFDTPDAEAVCRYAFEHHRMLMRPLGNVVYLMLPLIVDEELIRECVGVLREAVLAVVNEQRA